MTMFPTSTPHASQAHYDPERYAFYELRDAGGVYGHLALSEHADFLEMHLEVVRWGPRACRAMARDLEKLKALARERGISRILGVREEADGELDPRWPKFAKMYGFSERKVLQTVWLDL